MENFIEVHLSWALKVEDFLRMVLHGSKSKRQLRTKKQSKLTQKRWRWSPVGNGKSLISRTLGSVFSTKKTTNYRLGQTTLKAWHVEDREVEKLSSGLTAGVEALVQHAWSIKCSSGHRQ